MAWVLDTYSMMVGYQALGVVTGKPVSIGGSVGREEATGRGVMNVLRKFLATQNKQLTDARVADPGFGNVGYHTARLLRSAARRRRRSARRASAIYDESGIDVDAAGAYYRNTARSRTSRRRDEITNEELLACDCDVLIPAAMENTIDATSRPHVKARIVAKAPTAPPPRGRRDPPRQRRHRPPRHPRQRRRRDRQLLRMGAGAGQLLLGRKARAGRAPARHGKGFDAVNAKADEADCDYRTAAYTIAISRVAEALRLKGLFP
jgi:glutamate dehydrogenase/leucine dehydrogenase